MKAKKKNRTNRKGFSSLISIIAITTAMGISLFFITIFFLGLFYSNGLVLLNFNGVGEIWFEAILFAVLIPIILFGCIRALKTVRG